MILSEIKWAHRAQGYAQCSSSVSIQAFVSTNHTILFRVFSLQFRLGKEVPDLFFLYLQERKPPPQKLLVFFFFGGGRGEEDEQEN